jgi:hypothetical protein
MASGAAGGTAFGASRLPAMLQSIEEQRQLIRALEDHVDGLMLQVCFIFQSFLSYLLYSLSTLLFILTLCFNI